MADGWAWLDGFAVHETHSCSLALFFLIALAADISIYSRHGVLGTVSELEVILLDACRLLGVEMTTQSWDA